MGNTFCSASEDVIPFVERRYQDLVEVNGSDAVVGLFEANQLIDHRIGEIHEAF
jgi:hypothetical protein